MNFATYQGDAGAESVAGIARDSQGNVYLAGISVTIRGVTAQTQFIGAAPSYVSGLLQINAYLPTSIDFGDHVPLSVTVGKFPTQNNVTLAVK